MKGVEVFGNAPVTSLPIDHSNSHQESSLVHAQWEPVRSSERCRNVPKSATVDVTLKEWSSVVEQTRATGGSHPYD
jgi:hypothetical protein